VGAPDRSGGFKADPRGLDVRHLFAHEKNATAVNETLEVRDEAGWDRKDRSLA
jgi:hypothetical protein